MEQGVGIDPVTLRPARLSRVMDAGAKQAEDKKRLEEKAADLSLLQSDAAVRFKDLLLSRMEKRIAELIRQDSEAMAYQKLLEDWGHKVNVASDATEKLYLNHLRAAR